MKKEYDFSNGEKGKFFSKKTKLNIPVYLDEKTFEFISKIATKKRVDVSTVVNLLIKSDIKIAKTIQ